MKRLFILIGLLAAAPLLCLGAKAPARDADWAAVDKAIAAGLPKTAIELLDPIAKKAIAQKAWGEAARAICRRIQLETEIQGGLGEEKIRRLTTALQENPKELQPILQTVLAQAYWDYFQQNRWRFLQRSKTSQAPGKDFTTWDLSLLFQEIDRQFQASLGAQAFLKATPVASFNGILVPGTVPDSYRPTLYDFIAHEALRFYTSGEQSVAHPSTRIEWLADVPVYGVIPLFGTAAEFTRAAKIERRADESPEEKALFLFRDLMLFHQNDDDPSARLDVDLARIQWASNVAIGEARSRLHQEALTRFATTHQNHPISAKALFHLAETHSEAGSPADAHRVAIQGAQRYPKSPGGILCRQLVQSIESPSLQLAAEKIWLPDGKGPRAPLVIHYRNITNVSLRIFGSDWTNHYQSPGLWDESVRRRTLAKTPVWQGAYAIPNTPDFQEKVLELAQPTGLPPGFYLLVASPDPGFTEKKGPLAFTTLWVSDLALITRPRSGRLEGFVLDAVSGEPIPNASVRLLRFNPQRPTIRLSSTLTTDALGTFQSEAAPPGQGYLLEVISGNRRVGSWEAVSWNPKLAHQPQEKTLLFTDRSLYRPGQSIQFKGIRVLADTERNSYEPAKGSITLVFSDVNGQEIARQTHRVNEYGSFAGTVTAPKDRLLGMMSLYDQAHPESRTSFNVEEYKRPKFQVTLSPTRESPRLGEPVKVEGLALTLTGMPVASTEVRWRVTRTPEFQPFFAATRFHPSRALPRFGPQGHPEDLGSGSSQTDPDGRFTLEFVARPDLKIHRTNDPVFVFNVHVDITDSNGETRSQDRAFRIGYRTAQLTGTVAEWQTPAIPVRLAALGEDLEGNPLPLEGTVSIFQLRQPTNVVRPDLGGRMNRFPESPQPAKDLSQPESWELGARVKAEPFRSDAEGKTATQLKLATGAYRAVWTSRDRAGNPVRTEASFLVVDPTQNRFPIKIPQFVGAPSWSLEPGQTLSAIWGTGYTEGRAFIEIEHRNRPLRRFWTPAGATQHAVNQLVTETLRGGFTVHITQVRDNRALLTSHQVEVPWSNKELELKWEHWTSHLEPGKPQTWSVIVKPKVPTNSVVDPKAVPGQLTEMVAALYDASLDAIKPHAWNERFNIFGNGMSFVSPQFNNRQEDFQFFAGSWPEPPDPGLPDELYRRFEDESGVGNSRGLRWGTVLPSPMMAAPAAAMDSTARFAVAAPEIGMGGAAKAIAVGAPSSPPPAPSRPNAPPPSLGSVTPRRNLNETAFFIPQAVSDSNGVVRLTFTMPEALTEWRFLAFAHDRQLRSGSLEARAVTSKEIMVQPNPPRFVREGDALEFRVKVSNNSTNRQQGKVRLQFKVALDDRSADADLKNTTPELSFDLAPKESRSFSWPIQIPDGMGFLIYQAVASTDLWSDGEEGFLPVLSRKIFVTESMPLPIRGPSTQEFRFDRLLQSGPSRSLIHQGLNVQVVSQPAWYAVLALPYLMEFPHECSEQTFNRLYANSLARHVLYSDPKIKSVFDAWRATPALQSPLEKNQDLKSVLIEETPWLRQAQDETESRRRLGELFSPGRIESETQRLLQQLQEMQLSDGRWPWFPGGPGNDFITLYIASGIGRLRHLGVDIPIDTAIRAWGRLDTWIVERHRWILQHAKKESAHLDSTIALYLYARSLFLKEAPIPPTSQETITFWLDQARRHWLRLPDRLSQGHIALALQRWADPTTPQAIVKSLRERSVSTPELGMFWRDTESGWSWQQAPIETQAMMIEVLEEIAKDGKAVEDCQVWLLKQKQTQAWKTTKATADAVYALLLRGMSGLASDAKVEIQLAGNPVESKKLPGRLSSPEAGTGYYEKQVSGPDVRPNQGRITLTKTDPGVAWASVHWQYLEDISKIPPHTGTPLQLKKALYTRNAGGVLVPITGRVTVGTEVVVRLELRVDRDVEFVHLKDQRGSGLEPVNALSQYKYQDGLAYYESTRDTASHFFVDYLAKGAYVFEYSTRVQHAGQYQSGLAEIQCLYAPEFNSHSESVQIRAQLK